MHNFGYLKIMNESDLIDTELSDHYPLLASLKFYINGPVVERSELTDIPPGFKWNKNSDEQFKAAFFHPDIKKRIEDLKLLNDANTFDVDKYCNAITNLITNAANLSLKRKQLGKK